MHNGTHCLGGKNYLLAILLFSPLIYESRYNYKPTTHNLVLCDTLTNMENQKVKCERCGRIRDIFQYTKFETMVVEKAVRGHDNPDGSPYFVTIKEDIGEKRGYCEECAVEVNKWRHDLKERKDALDRAYNQILDNIALSSKPPIEL